ncbi:MAG: glycosyl hydrolase family 28 protein [Victivallaceae bacterium]|nr:glycosyl hydrolase family 28 protein [Victivallaceae bacterium]
MRNIKDYGAVGNGCANDTSAIQTAIDAGGMVQIPPGTYKCGTLYLKSHGGLHLESGAIILASTDPADYNADDFIVQNRASKLEKCSGAHLICAIGQSDLTLCGEGTVHGNSEMFFAGMERDWEDFGYYHIPSWRPAQMIFFCECDQVTVRGIKLRNPTYWSCFFHGCNDVIVNALDIKTDHLVRNTDGIDIDCCRNVVISDCLIDTGDDGITLRGNAAPLLRKQPCEHVTITNCVISSTCSGMRIGVGDGMIRNCMISNLVFYNTNTGLCFCSRYVRGFTQIRDLTFSNISFEGERFLEVLNDWLGRFYEHSEQPIRNLAFRDIQAKCKGPSFLIGNPGEGIDFLSLERIHFEESPGYCCEESFLSLPLADRWWNRKSRAFLVAVNLRHLRLSDLVCSWAEESAYDFAVELCAVDDLLTQACSFNKPVNTIPPEENRSEVETREFWQEKFDQYHASGEPLKQFCKEHNLREETMHRWECLLRVC